MASIQESMSGLINTAIGGSIAKSAREETAIKQKEYEEKKEKEQIKINKKNALAKDASEFYTNAMSAAITKDTSELELGTYGYSHAEQLISNINKANLISRDYAEAKYFQDMSFKNRLEQLKNNKDIKFRKEKIADTKEDYAYASDQLNLYYKSKINALSEKKKGGDK